MCSAARYESSEVFAGGVFAAANHIASFCKEVEVITCLGDSGDRADLVHASLQPNISLTAFERGGATTTVKRRFVDSSRVGKLFEIYMIEDDHLHTTSSRRSTAPLPSAAGSSTWLWLRISVTGCLPRHRWTYSLGRRRDSCCQHSDQYR